MSLKLLKRLNDNRRGPLRRWLETLDCAPRIAWYPSAGFDFRDLLFLQTELHREHDPTVPDLFLHTDCWLYGDWDFSEGKVLFEDPRTSVTISEIEVLPRLNLNVDPRLVYRPDAKAGTNTDQVVFMRLLVKSKRFGTFERPVLYAFVENAAFIGSIAQPAGAVFSHIIHVRYGGGFGGSTSAGGWLQHTLTTLGCELYITDGSTELCPADTMIRERYPDIWRPVPPLAHIRTVPGKSWSDHGDVQWLIVGRDRESISGVIDPVRERHGFR